MIEIKPLLLRHPTTRNHSKLAVTLGLPPETPDNVVRSYALGLRGINRAVRIKQDYDANNPPPPAPLQKDPAKPQE